MNVAALIPARGGSKRIPLKNLAPVPEFNGPPMLCWTIWAAQRAKAVDRVIVVTDHESVAEVARREGCEVMAQHPTDTSQLEDDNVLGDIVDSIDADITLFLQPTSPLRGAMRVNEAAAMMRSGLYASVVSVVRDAGLHFRWTRTATLTGQPLYQGRPPTQGINLYRETGAIYGFTREWWRKTRKRTGPGAALLELQDWEAVDVDTPYDLTLARVWMERQLQTHPGKSHDFIKPEHWR